jgi:pimeloyl-ACP methyl ester carboxylesterase
MASPTVVLVHGAFADASGWRGVHDELIRHDLTVVAPPNPLRGMTGGDGAYLSAAIDRIDGPVLLVGHSYGGAVITAAGNVPNVVGLVFVAGYAPDEDESINALQSNFQEPDIVPYVVQGSLPDGGAEFWLQPAEFAKLFCADIPEDEGTFLGISQRPLAGVALTEEAAAPAWRVRPSWAVLPTADRVIPPDVHRFSYQRAGTNVTEVEGASHAVMISHPEVVADVVLTAVRATAAQPV